MSVSSLILRTLVATELIRQLSRHPRLDARSLLLGKLKSLMAEVRTAAVDALAELRVTEAGEAVRELLDDNEPPVRRAAAAAVGRFGDRGAIEPLLRLSKDADPAVRRASLDSLRLLLEPRGIPLAVTALADRQTQTAALIYLGELGGPDQAQAVIDLANGDPTTEVVQLSAGLLTKTTKTRQQRGTGAVPRHRTRRHTIESGWRRPT